MKSNKIVLTFFALFSLAGCDIFPFFQTKVSKVSVNKTSLELEYDETVKIDASVYPNDASKKELTWTSSDNEVATVDNGYITGVGSGEAIITCTTTDGTKISNTINVSVAPLKKTTMEYTFNSVLKNNFETGYCASTKEDFNILVIPVWLNDSSNYIANNNKEFVRSDIETAFFGTNQETGWRSVKTYYEEESGGQINVGGFVTDWFSANKDISYYGDHNSRISNLRKNAVSWAKETYKDINWSDYDNDDDGFLDGIALIYGAPDSTCCTENGYGNYSELWYFVISVNKGGEPNIDSPAPADYMWCAYDAMYTKGQQASSRTGKASYGCGAEYINIDAHTYIHETGHLLGAIDLYDPDANSGPAGCFTMQDTTVGMHDPFTLLSFGWANAYIPKKSVTLNLKPFSSSRDVILLTPDFNSYNSPFDEYLLLQYYTPTDLFELDAKNIGYSPKDKSGIVVFHVDARLVKGTDKNNLNAANITSNPEVQDNEKVQFVCSNTPFNGSNGNKYYPLGSEYYNYNLVQHIANNTSWNTTRPFVVLSSKDLFTENNTFSMDLFKNQFANPGKLNSNKDLGWEFTVGKETDKGIEITFNKIGE